MPRRERGPPTDCVLDWQSRPSWSKDPVANPIVLFGSGKRASIPARATAVTISPDNRWLVTASSDQTARLWDLTAKDPAANPVEFRGHEGEITAVAISPDNHWLVTASLDSTRIWLLQLSNLIDLAKVVVGRNLTDDEWRHYFQDEPYHKTFPDLPDPKNEAAQ